MPKIYKLKTITGEQIELELQEKSKRSLVFKDVKSGVLYRVVVEKADNGKYVLNVNGEKHIVRSSKSGVFVDYIPPLVFDVKYEVVEEEKKRQKETMAIQVLEQNVLTSPITGRVVEVKVKQGDLVKQGDTVALLESMKMIIEIKAHMAGTVEEVYVEQGKTVNKGDKIIKIRPSTS